MMERRYRGKGIGFKKLIHAIIISDGFCSRSISSIISFTTEILIPSNLRYSTETFLLQFRFSKYPYLRALSICKTFSHILTPFLQYSVMIQLYKYLLFLSPGFYNAHHRPHKRKSDNYSHQITILFCRL